jgi:hypothetical protein
MAKRKHGFTWADKFYGLLMEQKVTEENMSYAVVAVGAWLGEKASTMPRDDFETLLEKAIEELQANAWEWRRPEDDDEAVANAPQRNA